MKIVFMGTPDFASAALEALIEAGHEIVLVVTQPDKPKGRHGQMTPPDVKVTALKYDLPVFQPDKIRKEEHIAYLKDYPADVFVVAAFGQILPKEILDMPKYCCVNIHASLLPKYRGASPIQWSIINGDLVTGVTTMRLDEGMDTGDMIQKEEVKIREDETAGELFDRLAHIGGQLCLRTLEAIENGSATYTPQDPEQATYTKMIKKSLGEIDFMKPAVEISNLVRGLNPWPSAYTYYNGKMLKLWKTAAVDITQINGADVNAAPGTVALVDKKELIIATGDGGLKITELQLEGKKRMETEAFLRGVQIEKGTVFGSK